MDEAKREPGVVRELNRSKEADEGLIRMIEKLEARLGPVLRSPCIKEKDNEKTDERELTDLEKAIRLSTGVKLKVIEDIADIIDRMEL